MFYGFVLNLFVMLHCVLHPSHGMDFFTSYGITVTMDQASPWVKIQFHDPTGVAPALQEITITHSAARSFSGEKPVVIGPSPGIVLLLPVAPSCSIFSNAQYRSLPPQRVAIMDGSLVAGAELSCNMSDIPRESAWMYMLELNAVINNHLHLCEAVKAPTTIGVERSKSIISAFDEITGRTAGVRLEPENLDIAQHILAVQVVTTLLLGIDESEAATAVRPDSRVMKLKQFLSRNLDKRIYTSDMARHLFMSRSAFNRLITPMLGMPPAHYLRQLRLSRSLELLSHAHDSIETIAERTGFNSRYHFSNAFKRQYRITPGKYRKIQSKNTNRDLQDAQRLLRSMQYAEALVAYDRALQHVSSNLEADRIRHQKTQCLFGLGRFEEASQILKSLMTGPCAFEAGVQLCKNYFSAGDYDSALETFRYLYSDANAIQHEDLIHIWDIQVSQLTELRRPQPLNRYLEIRRKHFSNDFTSMHVTWEALIQTGQYDRVTAECAALTVELVICSRYTGKYAEALQRYGEQVSGEQRARTMIQLGMYEEVLGMPDISPSLHVNALVLLGRAEEAIERYPDHCAEALLACRQYERIIDAEAGVMSLSYAYYASGRGNELRTLWRDGTWLWLFAQFYVDPAAILASKAPDRPQFVPAAHLLLSLAALSENDRNTAQRHLDQLLPVYDPDIWISDYDATIFLIAPLVHGMTGDMEGMNAEYESIIDRRRFMDAQRLWHDVALLTNTIDTEAYKQQPTKPGLENRLAFVQAVKSDLEDSPAEASDRYKAYLVTTQSYPVSHLMRHRFAEWRIQELQESPA